MIAADEIRHLADGARPGEVPAGAGLVHVSLRALAGPEVVLERVRGVLRTVLTESSEAWPTPGTWRELLPQWFVEACAPEQSEEEIARWLAGWRALSTEDRARAERERGWTLTDWLYWLQPGERQWYWWEGMSIGSVAARVVVQVVDHSSPLGALVWLLTAAGASSIVISENIPA